MNRKLAVAVASACMMAPAPLYALGLGVITLHSHLDEKLKADIRLYSDNPGELEGALVSLAGPSAFTRAGIGRPLILSDLHFKVVHNVKGHPAIQVTSDRPIREPFLDFIVEIGWRNGRILRQYTVLLNPPTMTALRPVGVHPAAAVAATRTPASAVAPLAGGASPVAGVGASPSRRGAVQRAGTPQPAGNAHGTIRTVRNDTLWGIARRVRPNDRVSIEQMMLALLNANPQAFYDHNINRLKAGYVLRVPDVSQVLGIDPRKALAQVRHQNLLWERYRRRLARVATGAPRAVPNAAGAKPGAGVPSAAQQEQERLRLLAPKAGEAAATGAPGGAAGVSRRALKDRLALANEAAASKTAEAKDLQGRVNALQGQVGRLKELLSLKNQQLAALQARSRTGTGFAAVPPAPAKPAVTTPPAETSKAATPAPKPAHPVAPPPALRHPVTPAPARVQTPPPAPRVGSLRELLNDRGVLAMLGGAFLALVALAWLVVRRRRSTESGLPLEAESRALADGGADGEADGEAGDAEIFAQTLGDEQEVSGAMVAEAGGDALAEAEIYLAYGRYEQAAEQLAQAVRNEPDRADLKAKLLEAYHALADHDAFESTAEALYADLGDASHPLWQDVAQWGAELCPEHPLFREEPGAEAESSVGAGPDAEAQAADAAPEAGVESTAAEEPTGEVVDELLRSLVAEEPAQEADEGHPAAVAAPVDETSAADRSQDLPAVPEFETSGDQSEEPSGAHEAQEQGGADSGFPLPDTEPETSEEAHASEPAAEATPIEEAATVEETLEPAESNVIEWEGGLASDGAARAGEEAAGEEAAGEEAAEGEAAEGEAAREIAGDAGEDAVLGEPDEVGTKLDLARAYLDMGDQEGARELLVEVIEEGSDPQREEAEGLMQQLSA